MIHLSPPYQVVNGYTLLPDHADPSLFYVLPSAPRIAEIAAGQPAFFLTQFLGGGTDAARIAGGLLTLTTELTVPAEVLPALTHQLSERLGDRAPSALTLAPVLFDEGSVELIALGSTSGSAAAPDGPFHLTFLGSGKTSLGGTNTAAFQLVLDPAAAELIERSLESPALPLIAVYRMAFSGLRPSFQIDVKADWHRVYTSLQNRAKANIYFVAADADVMVTEALEESNIRIDTAVFGAGESARAAAERARKYLTDWVFQRLFTPMVDPQAATANAVGRVIDDTIFSLTRSVLPGVSYKLRSLSEDQLRLLSARMNESVAERVEIVPQGTLGGFLHRYQVNPEGIPRPEWPATRAALLNKVNLNGFPRLEVQVGVEDRFAADGLLEVRVELARVRPEGATSHHSTLSFRNASEREEYLVNLLGEEEAALSRPYRYRVEARFDPAGVFGAHPPAVSDWRDGNTRELFAEPRDAYSIRNVEVLVAPLFSFAQFSSVTVELRYPAASQVPQHLRMIELTAQSPQQSWHFREFESTPRPYSYRTTYHRPPESGGNIEVPWREQLDAWLTVPDPMPVKRPLNLFVSLPWPEILVAFAQIRYEDAAHGVRFTEQIDLNEQTKFIPRTYSIHEEGPTALSYRLTILLANGTLMEGSWRETEEDRLVLDRRLVESRIITLRVLGGSLEEHRLQEVRIPLKVLDAAGQTRAETTIHFTRSSEPPPAATWEYLPGDPPLKTVQYSALFEDTRGFIEHLPARSTSGDLLVIHLRNKTISA